AACPTQVGGMVPRRGGPPHSKDRNGDHPMLNYLTGQPLEIGPGPHLFLDDHLIEDRRQLSRRVNPPYRHPGNPIIVADRPWEERPYRPQVVRNPETGGWRMYYMCFSGTNYWSRKGPSYYACYAESADGIRWEKPERADLPFDPWPATNVLHVDDERDARIQAPWVFFDPHDTDPAHAWKMIYNSAGLRLAYSPDGIHWTPARPEPLFAYHSDTMNHVLWNERAGKWVLYMRPPMFSSGQHEGPGVEHHRRRTAVSFSDDLLNWSVPRTVLYPDELDPTPHIDSVHVFPYAGHYIAFVTMLDATTGGTNELMLASSRDGLRWERPLPRQVWLSRGREGDFDGGCVSIGSDPIRVGWELWFPMSGFPMPQKVFEQESGIGIVKMMVDRFLSLEAPEPSLGGPEDFGWLLTKEFIWRGKTLTINCRMNNGDSRTYGDLRVEVVKRPNDADPAGRMGQVVPGHGAEDCDLIRSNSPVQTVTWNGNPDLGFLDGQPVYLRFRIRNGGLFAFRMGE
ncbi:MAG TPA: hypothetical protein P5569_10620, partial [Candidatus Latescibacteria bacterium]|nr:hypothetical protein [Candidatus Latescibacterota bacterium]